MAVKPLWVKLKWNLSHEMHMMHLGIPWQSKSKHYLTVGSLLSELLWREFLVIFFPLGVGAVWNPSATSSHAWAAQRHLYERVDKNNISPPSNPNSCWKNSCGLQDHTRRAVAERHPGYLGDVMSPVNVPVTRCWSSGIVVRAHAGFFWSITGC